MNVVGYIHNNKYLKPSLILLLLIGMAAKLFLFNFQYVDFGYYLSSWIEEIKLWGWQKALSEGSYNYTPSYIYILIGLSKLDLNPLYSIKLVSIFFEYFLAFFIGKLLYLYYKKKSLVLISMVLIPLFPTVLLNSAFMSQCDSIYASFVIGSIYFLLTKRQFSSLIFLGIAFSFKMQSVFILPFYFVFMLRGGIRWYMFLIIPCVYILSILPAWFAGRGFVDLLTIYVSQSNYNQELVKNFPNIYQWIRIGSEGLKFVFLAIVFGGTLVGAYVLKQKKYVFTLEVWYKLIFLCFVLYPMLLPGMLERYMYMGDVWALIYAFINFRNVFPALGIIFVSFYSYIRTIYMFSFSPQALYPSEVFSVFENIPWEIVSILYIVVVVYLYFGFVVTLHKDSGKKEFLFKESTD